jgi:hypothetical protein
MSESKVLRGIFKPKREEVASGMERITYLGAS